MKKTMKKIVSMILTVCLLAVCIPVCLPTAAEEYQWELDTDGIDAGAEYLIVSGTAATSYALMRDDNYCAAKEVKVVENKTIASFSGDAACTFVFSANASTSWTTNTIKNNDYHLSVGSSISFSTYSTNVSVRRNSSTAKYYRIRSGSNTSQYIGYYNNSWRRVGSSYANVYLYKKVVTASASYTVTYDGNGYTEGVLPEAQGDLKSGNTYVVAAATQELKKTVGNEVYYFAGWNTAADGSGTTYQPGSTLTMGDADVTLYAQWQKRIHTVTYDGNGYTEGVLPGNRTDLYEGDLYTVAAPTEALKKIDGSDVYLFHCWNTAADGNGTDYMPGSTLTVGTEDITLYAKWYLEQKYTITVRCNLDGVPHAIPHNHGDAAEVYVSRDGVNYIKLDQQEVGVYVTTVKDNGDYQVYIGHDGHYESAHGHMVYIYNQSGETTLQNFTVTYDKGYDGAVAEGDTDGWQEIYHAYTTIYADTTIPVRAGYTFKGWKDAEGNTVQGDQLLTASLTAPIRLTAQWEKTTNVQVEIVLDHKAPDGGFNNTTDKHEVQIQLLQQVNGVHQPVGDPVTLNDATKYNEATHTTTYSYTFKDLPAGDYSVSSAKSGYSETVTVDENGVIHIVYTYAPDDFDLHFTVETVKGTPAELRPTAVNLRVLYWGYNEDGTLGWNIITQHGDGKPPVTVTLDANGNGSGFYTVWKDWADYDHPYIYRLMVSSFVMPDGTVVMADSNDYILYTPNGSGLYTATMVVNDGNTLPDGIVPAPELDGAYYDGTQQQGALKVVLDVHPMTVTFDCGEGNLNGESLITLTNQFAYPDLNRYLPTREGKIFDGWYLDADCTIPAENHHQSYLTADVTYYAKWRDNMTLSGTIIIDGLYKDADEWVSVHDADRATEAAVLLLKETAGAFNVVDVQIVKFPKNYGDEGQVTYSFAIPDENATYRIEVLELNYTSTYDNNGDDSYTLEEYTVLPGEDGNATIDVHLDFKPETYVQAVQLDASQISENYRPTGALVQYEYRDLGKYTALDVIAQHDKAPYGLVINTERNGLGKSGYAVWNWHTDGSLYEYQARLFKLYGHVPGVYETEGTAYTNDLPYYVRYGGTSWYNHGLEQQNNDLMITIVPKQYEVIFDLGFESEEVVSGMEGFVTSGADGDYYAYRHTWSYGDKFIAFPYRPGYVFKGWHSDTDGVLIHNNGEVTVATGLMENVTITAQWEEITGTAAVIRYLEKNTNKVLHGSKVINAPVGTVIKMVDEVLTIPGYEFDYDSNMDLVVTNDNNQNVMTIYYLPDGSDGYTEQVESNLHLDKSAILENNGTYTVWMETFTTDNPVTTLIQQDTPMDIVLVLDQSGSMYDWYYDYENYKIRYPLDDLKLAVGNFIDLVAEHGRTNQTDHRIAIVGFGSDNLTSNSGTSRPVANSNKGYWCNTGVFDSHGVFHNYPVKGFNYVAYTGLIDEDGVYYTKVGDDYLLLTYHDEYRHLIDELGARTAMLQGKTVYGYVYNDDGVGEYVELSRNSSGLWLYGEKQLYSAEEFFTLHTDVWTHRNGTGAREIHAYGSLENYAPVDGHDGIYTRTEVSAPTDEADLPVESDQSIYTDALVPVTTEARGAGEVTPGLLAATETLGASGRTYVSYGMKMANSILEATKDTAEDRLRVVVVFTDGKPGDSSNFDEDESNRALQEASKAQKEYGALVYTVGLYGNDVQDYEKEDQLFFLHGLSSNFPDAQTMDDVWKDVEYLPTTPGFTLGNGGPYFVEVDGQYYRLRDASKYVNQHNWGYDYNGQFIQVAFTEGVNNHPTIGTDSVINGYTIYRRYGLGYENDFDPNTDNEYYAEATSPQQLKDHFSEIMKKLTTTIQVDIVLHEDTILRDIMGQGLVLTDDTVITAYKVAGDFNFYTGQIDWARHENGEYVLEYVASLDMSTGKLVSDETASIEQMDGTEKDVPYIQVYNYGSANPTDPLGADYHPHTVDVTGYDFSNWYIDGNHPDGYMMVVSITRIEATDDVEWGRSTLTNNKQSGLWLPVDTFGERKLLLPFEQPTTIFVERAYVLDYAKPFTLEGWYFDDEDGKEANPLHIDAAIPNGMNWFDTNNPNLSNQIGNYYGNTKYGNVTLQNGTVTYTPTTMNWDGMDEFYVFGNTWRKTVLAQDANENGNLWSKVQVIPANSVYYEDSFITTGGDGVLNDFDGFTFDDNWSVVYDGTDADNNTEKPEHLEEPPYGDVHGWIDALVSEGKFSDGSAHFTNGIGATASFTFTGCGVDVYTRTNNQSGVVVATLYHQELVYENGAMVTRWAFHDGIIMDNLAVSGDYYQIPTISFMDLPHGTYKVELIASASTTSNKDDNGNWIGDTPVRTEYHIDGIRVYKPLSAEMEKDPTIRYAYELETNAEFTEVRDILLDYGDFNVDMEDSADGTAGAVFIDWIREWQGSGNDQPGVGVPTYEIGTFNQYGPKNEVYLSSGQAIVLKVDPNNTYFVGLKSLDGNATIANVSGITTADPVAICLSHTADLYYRVTPIDGYIVIQNGATNNSVLSVTKIRATNLNGAVKNGGILPVTGDEAVEVMTAFSRRLMQNDSEDEAVVGDVTPIDPTVESFRQFLRALFGSVRAWLKD